MSYDMMLDVRFRLTFSTLTLTLAQGWIETWKSKSIYICLTWILSQCNAMQCNMHIIPKLQKLRTECIRTCSAWIKGWSTCSGVKMKTCCCWCWMSMWWERSNEYLRRCLLVCVIREKRKHSINFLLTFLCQNSESIYL